MEFHCKMKNGFDKKLQISLERKKVVCRLIIVSMDRVNECIYLGIEKEERNCGILGSRKGNTFVFPSTRTQACVLTAIKRSVPAYQRLVID